MGVELVEMRGQLVSDGDPLFLAPENLVLSKTLRGAQPDVVVDASGHRRLSARHLGIGARFGPRKDAAYFSHLNGGEPECPAAQVRINRLQKAGRGGFH